MPLCTWDSAKSWSLVWPLVSNPCQCFYIAWDIVCCSWQMVRESWSPDCHWREGSSSGTRVWIRNYPCTWQIRHWCSLETLCWILLWGQASWDLLYTLIVYFEVSHSMTLVTSVVEPDLLSSWLLRICDCVNTCTRLHDVTSLATARTPNFRIQVDTPFIHG